MNKNLVLNVDGTIRLWCWFLESWSRYVTKKRWN